jgi:hypothetical protein
MKTRETSELIIPPQPSGPSASGLTQFRETGICQTSTGVNRISNCHGTLT